MGAKRVLAAALCGFSLMAAPKYQLRELNIEIYALQSRLRDLGYYNLKTTGILGTLTQNALMEMQLNNNLTVEYDLTQQGLDAAYDIKLKSPLTQNARYATNGMALEAFSDGLLDRLPDQFTLVEPLTQHQYTFLKSGVQECVLGKLKERNQDFDLHAKKAVIAVIDGKNYPASLEVTKEQTQLFVMGCKTPDGKEDALHNYNMQKLLSLS